MSSEMLSADKYLSIVNDSESLLRFLESRVNRKVQARFGCDVQSRMSNRIDWKVRSLLGDALFSAPT
jgi:hypothetical protein